MLETKVIGTILLGSPKLCYSICDVLPECSGVYVAETSIENRQRCLFYGEREIYAYDKSNWPGLVLLYPKTCPGAVIFRLRSGNERTIMAPDLGLADRFWVQS